MLILAEHENFRAHICKNANNYHFHVNMPLTGIFTLMSRTKILYEPEKKLIFLYFYTDDHLNFHAQLRSA